MAFGGGEFFIGGVATVLVYAVLFGLAKVENLISRVRSAAHFDLRVATVADADGMRELLKTCGGRCQSWSIGRDAEGITVEMEVIGRQDQLDTFRRKLVEDGRVRSVRRT
jgi:hypothetical protein